MITSLNSDHPTGTELFAKPKNELTKFYLPNN